MKGLIVKVGPLQSSFHGGLYKRVLVKNIDKGSKEEAYIFDCYLNHSKSSRFLPYLKPQAILDNLSIIQWNNKKVIDGNSDFKYLGQRHD